MTEKLKEVIKREVAKLPKENQEVINSSGWERISEEIGKRYLINEKEINDFQTQTLLVLIGLEEIDYYPDNIENNVGLSKREAMIIAREVDKKIFKPIVDAIAEKIKNSDVIKNPKWDQSLNFILSGGNYSSFMAPTAENTQPVDFNPEKKTNPPILPPKPQQ